MRIIDTDDIRQIKRIMQGIGADRSDVRSVAQKGIFRLLKLRNINSARANILKQEMLAVGGDVCLIRHALNRKRRTADCLIMGTSSQYQRLLNKLNVQPQAWGTLYREISLGLRNYQRAKRTRTQIMGIINVTPDSFSGDGLLAKGMGLSEIIKSAEDLVNHGADIIDVGGVSSRPGARAISEKEEYKRTIPVVEGLSKSIKAPISIDTYRPEIARVALQSGASIVNDITGLRNPRMIKLVAKTEARIIIMHMKGMPWNMQKNPEYKSLIDEIIEYLDTAIKRAIDAGINKERMIVDPGIGFGKTVKHNLEILGSLQELKILGCPILVGPSRKSFIGKILKLPPQERLIGTLASLAAAVINGADIVRVHDVKYAAQAVKIADAIKFKKCRI